MLAPASDWPSRRHYPATGQLMAHLDRRFTSPLRKSGSSLRLTNCPSDSDWLIKSRPSIASNTTQESGTVMLKKLFIVVVLS